jgi:hypothetical protein
LDTTQPIEASDAESSIDTSMKAPSPVRAAAHQRGADRERRRHAGQGVGHRIAHAQRRAVGRRR